MILRRKILVSSARTSERTFVVKAVTGAAKAYSTPALRLTRGARRLRFFQGQHTLVVMRGEIEHKNLGCIINTRAERQLTNLAPGFDIRDFDIAADGREIVVDRVQEQSDIVDSVSRKSEGGLVRGVDTGKMLCYDRTSGADVFRRDRLPQRPRRLEAALRV